MHIKDRRVAVLIIAVLIAVTAIFAYAQLSDVAYAAPKLDFGNTLKDSITKSGDDDFKVSVTRVRIMYGLDVEEVGTLSKARHIIASGLATLASFIFALQVLGTFFAVCVMNWAQGMDIVTALSDKIGTYMSSVMGGIFSFGDTSSPVFYLIFFAMIGVVLSLARMRVSEGFAKFFKTILLVALCMYLMTNGATVFNSINGIADEVSKSFSSGVVGNSKQSTCATVWDINVVRPWKILQFGDMSFKGTALDATMGTENQSQQQDNASQAEQSMRAARSDGVNGVDGYAESSTASFDWYADTYRPRWKKDISAKGKKDVTGVLGKYTGAKNDGGKMYKMIGMIPSKRDDAATAIAEIDKGYFELSEGVQGARVGSATILCALSIPLNVATLAISLVIIALKLVALFMFFLWPIVMLWALATNNMSSISKWLVSVAVALILGIVVQFMFSMIIGIVGMIHADNVTLGYWALGQALTVALFIAGVLVWPRIAEIVGQPGAGGNMRSTAARLWHAKQMHDIREATKAMGEKANGGNGNGESDGGGEKHDKFDNPAEKFADDNANSENDEEIKNKEFGEIPQDEEKEEEHDDTLESSEPVGEFTDEGLEDGEVKAEDMESPEQPQETSEQSANEPPTPQTLTTPPETPTESGHTDQPTAVMTSDQVQAAKEKAIADADADAERAMQTAESGNNGGNAQADMPAKVDTPTVAEAVAEATGQTQQAVEPAQQMKTASKPVERVDTSELANRVYDEEYKKRLQQKLHDNALKKQMGAMYEKRTPTAVEEAMAKRASNRRAVEDYIRAEKNAVKQDAATAKQIEKAARKEDKQYAREQFAERTVGTVRESARGYAGAVKDTVTSQAREKAKRGYDATIGKPIGAVGRKADKVATNASNNIADRLNKRTAKHLAARELEEKAKSHK